MSGLPMEGSEHRDCAKISGFETIRRPDSVTVEKGLEISISIPETGDYPLGITMRSPGNDIELVHGFLYSEGVISSKDNVIDLLVDGDLAVVHLDETSSFNTDFHSRRTTVNSSCGICGRSTIDDMLHMHPPPLSENVNINLEIISKSLELMSSQQVLFSSTGGSHACASFSSTGELIKIFEDVGRHNAMDKLVGSYLIEGGFPICDEFVIVSGRASFKLVHKALLAGFPIMIAIGAPSNIAIDMANENGMTLACFAKSESMTVYSAMRRIET